MDPEFVVVLVKQENTVFHYNYNEQGRKDTSEYRYLVIEYGKKSEHPYNIDTHNDHGKEYHLERPEKEQEYHRCDDHGQYHKPHQLLFDFFRSFGPYVWES